MKKEIIINYLNAINTYFENEDFNSIELQRISYYLYLPPSQEKFEVSTIYFKYLFAI